MSHDPNAAGLAVNWHIFGSNGLEKADYSQGVLERFTRRAPNDWGSNKLVKDIVNPRFLIVPLQSPHAMNYFKGFYSVNENGDCVKGAFNFPVATEKIVINHYFSKSREEFLKKRERGRAAKTTFRAYGDFDKHDHNEEFDNGILKYRDARAKIYQPPKPRSDADLIKALERNLSPTLSSDTPIEFYAGKMETFLTCRAVAAYLQTKLADNSQAKFFEEESLKAILKTFASPISVADKGLFDKELPELLKLPYPVIKEIKAESIKLTPKN